MSPHAKHTPGPAAIGAANEIIEALSNKGKIPANDVVQAMAEIIEQRFSPVMGMLKKITEELEGWDAHNDLAQDSRKLIEAQELRTAQTT